jgi:mono/diheme cytochrome c family protein
MHNKSIRRLTFAAALCGAAMLVGCHNGPPPKPLDQLTSQEVDGHRVYQAHCAACHYDRVSEPLHGPALRGVFKKPYLPSGAPANDDRVTATILHGRNLMPAQPNTDPQELADLLAYLHTL